MISREFAYWLQGYYELAKPTELDEEVTTLVKRHLELVLHWDKAPGDLILWLQGVLALTDPKKLDARVTKMIGNRLADIFQHVIDPSYTDDQQQQQLMQDIHDGTHIPLPDHLKPGGGGHARC